MYPEEEARRKREQDIIEFKLLLRAFQEIIDKTSKRIEEIRCLGKEIYGINVLNPSLVKEQCHTLLEKGEEEFLDWARLIGEGLLLEDGRKHLMRRKVESELLLEVLKGFLARTGED